MHITTKTMGTCLHFLFQLISVGASHQSAWNISGALFSIRAYYHRMCKLRYSAVISTSYSSLNRKTSSNFNSAALTGKKILGDNGRSDGPGY